MENTRMIGTRHSLVRALVKSARCVLDPNGWDGFVRALQKSMIEEQVPDSNQRDVDRYLLGFMPEVDKPKSDSTACVVSDDDFESLLKDLHERTSSNKKEEPCFDDDEIVIENVEPSPAQRQLETIQRTHTHPFEGDRIKFLFAPIRGLKVNGIPMGVVMTSQFTRRKADGTRITENINGKIDQAIIRNSGPKVILFENDEPLELRNGFKCTWNGDQVEGRMWFYLVYLNEGLKVTLWHNFGGNGSGVRDLKRLSYTYNGGKIVVRDVT